MSKIVSTTDVIVLLAACNHLGTGEMAQVPCSTHIDAALH